MKFSQRMGIEQVPNMIQIESMNNALRASLWSVLYISEFQLSGSTRFDSISTALWVDYFKIPVDERPHASYEILQEIRNYFFSCTWNQVYDFIEFCIAYTAENLVTIGEDLSIPINRILERELSGYWIIAGRIVPISSPQEVETIQSAIADETFPGASAHLKTALDLLSRKTDPDYRNSIKESISAVESACRSIAGSPSATLGMALKELAKSHSLHEALKEGFLKLYGYTSDSDGIRHAMLDEPHLKQPDAVYFLISCSAFVNYLKTKIMDQTDRAPAL